MSGQFFKNSCFSHFYWAKIEKKKKKPRVLASFDATNPCNSLIFPWFQTSPLHCSKPLIQIYYWKFTTIVFLVINNLPLMQMLPPQQKSQLAPETTYTEIYVSWKMIHSLVSGTWRDGICEYCVESPVSHRSDQKLYKQVKVVKNTSSTWWLQWHITNFEKCWPNNTTKWLFRNCDPQFTSTREQLAAAGGREILGNLSLRTVGEDRGMITIPPKPPSLPQGKHSSSAQTAG